MAKKKEKRVWKDEKGFFIPQQKCETEGCESMNAMIRHWNGKWLCKACAMKSYKAYMAALMASLGIIGLLVFVVF